MKEIKGRTKIINYLIKKYNLKSYLEIGCAYKHNFNMVECEDKIGVDPAYDCDYKMISDEFFKVNGLKFDLIFIDGLHHWEQVYRDFINATAILNSGGFILMHDCLPTCKEQQGREKHPIVGLTAWTGDVWKAIVKLREQGWDIKTIDSDWGIGLYKFGALKNRTCVDSDGIALLSYKFYEQHRDKLLNVISLEQFYDSY